MQQIHFSRAALVIMVLPLMSLHSGRKTATPLEILQEGNDKLRKEIIEKETKRIVIEKQIYYHDSVRISKLKLNAEH